MTKRLVTAALLLAAAVGLDLGQAAAVDKKAIQRAMRAAQLRAEAAKNERVNDLSMCVDALLALTYFDFTPPQLEALAKLTREANLPKSQARQPGKASEKYRQALLNLYEALAQGTEVARVSELEDQVDALRDAENPDLDDVVEITDAARQRTPEVLRLLTIRQTSAYLDIYEAPDPLEDLLTALNKVSTLKDAEWKDLVEETVDEVGWLLGGLDEKKVKAVREQVSQWLKQVQAAKGKAMEKQRPELEKAARDLASQVPPTQMLNNVIEHALAELLANPQLPAAIPLRLKALER